MKNSRLQDDGGAKSNKNLTARTSNNQKSEHKTINGMNQSILQFSSVGKKSWTAREFDEQVLS